MKFLKTVFLFCLFASAAITIRILVFGRPGALNPQETGLAAVSEAPVKELGQDPVESVPISQARSPGIEPGNQEPPRWEFEGVQVVGYVMRGKTINLWLSDGRFLTERDKELTEVRKNYAVIGGRRVWFQAPYRSPGSKGEVQGFDLLQAGQSGRADSPGTGPQRVAQDASQGVSPL